MPNDHDIALWLAKYNRAYTAFVRGAISQREAQDVLTELRFRSDALLVELLEWEKGKARRQKDARIAARHKLGLIIGSTNEQTQNGEATP